MSTDIVTYDEIQAISHGPFRATTTGLVILEDDVPYELWEAYGGAIRRVEGAVQWIIGDWLNYGERKYGEMYAQAMDETDYEKDTLKKAKWVAGKVERCRRRHELGFSAHAEVAKLEPEEQDYWLAEAVEQGYTVRGLREAIREARLSNVLEFPAGEYQQHIELYQGDMLEVLPTLDKRFDLVVTDPPYGVTNWEWDILETSQWLDVIIPMLADEYNIFWFCSPSYAADIEYIFRDKELPIQSRIIWHRRNMSMGSKAKGKFIDSWEMILHAGNRNLNFPEEWSDAWFDVQTFAVPQTNFSDRKVHPTQKPEGLIERLVTFGSYPGDSILDPFSGGGTTGVVCPGNRQCTLIEKEEVYAEITEGRLSIRRREVE